MVSDEQLLMGLRKCKELGAITQVPCPVLFCSAAIIGLLLHTAGLQPAAAAAADEKQSISSYAV
jgi:hypothetical protein